MNESWWSPRSSKPWGSSADVRSSSRLYAAVFPEIRGAPTYGRSLNQLRRRMPEVLRLWDRDPSRVDIVEVLDLPTSIKRAISIE